MSGGGVGVPLARAVRVRTSGVRPVGSVDRLPYPMTPKQLHQWVRDRYGDRAAYWPEDMKLGIPRRVRPTDGRPALAPRR